MKMKRLAALVAVSMVGIQLVGAGTAFAASTCDFGSNDLEITLADDNVSIWVEDEKVFCDPNDVSGAYSAGSNESLPVSVLQSITVEMDDDTSDAELYIGLKEQGTTGDAAEWPDLDTFDIDVTTELHLDGTGVGSAGANRLRVVAGASTLTFGGTEATYTAGSLDFTGGGGKDSFDGTKATVRIYADGKADNDLLKGGTAKDTLKGDAGIDILYGNGGNDSLDCGANGLNTAATYEQGWGGADSDYIKDCNVVAPGAGDDDINNTGTYTPGVTSDPGADDPDNAAGELVLVSYGDLTKGIEWDDTTTGGEAGDDYFNHAPYKLSGSAGDDVIFDSSAVTVSAGAGDDVAKVSSVGVGGTGNDLVAEYGTGADNVLYGNAGDDVLRGKAGDDSLFGGAGKDQAWGASGADTCKAEVTNRCDYGKI